VIEPVVALGAHETVTGEDEVEAFVGDVQFIVTVANNEVEVKARRRETESFNFTMSKLPEFN
jgi:hypothetical protein